MRCRLTVHSSRRRYAARLNSVVRRHQRIRMAFPHQNHLKIDQIRELVSNFLDGQSYFVDRIRYKNRTELRTTVRLDGGDVRRLVLSSFESGHQPGGDLEVMIPGTNDALVGHHDGVYWIAPYKSSSLDDA